mgnify:CR=1 FL=1
MRKRLTDIWRLLGDTRADMFGLNIRYNFVGDMVEGTVFMGAAFSFAMPWKVAMKVGQYLADGNDIVADIQDHFGFERLALVSLIPGPLIPLPIPMVEPARHLMVAGILQAEQAREQYQGEDGVVVYYQQWADLAGAEGPVRMAAGDIFGMVRMA